MPIVRCVVPSLLISLSRVTVAISPALTCERPAALAIIFSAIVMPCFASPAVTATLSDSSASSLSDAISPP